MKPKTEDVNYTARLPLEGGRGPAGPMPAARRGKYGEGGNTGTVYLFLPRKK